MLMEVETGGFLELASRHAQKSTSSMFSERPAIHLRLPHACTHTHTHRGAHIHIHTRTHTSHMHEQIHKYSHTCTHTLSLGWMCSVTMRLWLQAHYRSQETQEMRHFHLAERPNSCPIPEPCCHCICGDHVAAGHEGITPVHSVSLRFSLCPTVLVVCADGLPPTATPQAHTARAAYTMPPLIFPLPSPRKQ